MGKTVVRKVFVNKKTGQGSVTIPKKEFKKLNPSIHFGENLFVKLEFLEKVK